MSETVSQPVLYGSMGGYNPPEFLQMEAATVGESRRGLEVGAASDLVAMHWPCTDHALTDCKANSADVDTTLSLCWRKQIIIWREISGQWKFTSEMEKKDMEDISDEEIGVRKSH